MTALPPSNHEPGAQSSPADPAATARTADPARPAGQEKTTRSGAIHAFLGASVLTAALLLPHARLLPIGGGIVLAAAIRWTWSRFVR